MIVNLSKKFTLLTGRFTFTISTDGHGEELKVLVQDEQVDHQERRAARRPTPALDLRLTGEVRSETNSVVDRIVDELIKRDGENLASFGEAKDGLTRLFRHELYEFAGLVESGKCAVGDTVWMKDPSKATSGMGVVEKIDANGFAITVRFASKPSTTFDLHALDVSFT